MTDDQLRSELDRRADSVDLPREWAKHDLLPAVTLRMETRPQRVASSRMPAFAGLAAVVAIFLILVVALPRLAPAPGQTDTAPASSTQPVVLSPQEFSTRLSAGELRNVTVLVDGTIGERPPGAGIECHVTSGQRCLMGTLEAARPQVDVQSRWFPTDERNPSVGASDVLWAWTHLPGGPITGLLALSVDVGGTVEFLGVGGPTGAEPPVLNVDQALGREAVRPEHDEVLLVAGRMVDAEFPGAALEGDCQPEDFAPITTLPSRFCLPLDYIAHPDPTAERKADDVQGPHFFVQREAQRFMDPSTNGAATYVIAPRLYGDGCDAVAPPCWQWDVVGRLLDGLPAPPRPTATPEPEPTAQTPTPTLPTSEAFTCAQVASPRDPSVFLPVSTLEDETGLVERCEDEFAPADKDEALIVDNAEGSQKVLRLTWAGLCNISPNFTLRRSDEGYELVVTTPPPGLICDGFLHSHDLRIFLAQPILRADLRVTYTQRPEWPPVVSPPAVTCPDVLTLIDRTSLVTGCDTSVELAPNGQGVTAGVDGSTYTLEAHWQVPQVCDQMPAHIELWPPVRTSRLIAPPPRYTLHVDVPTSTGAEGCLDSVATQTVSMSLSQRIDVVSVDFVVTRAGVGHDSIDNEAGTFSLDLTAPLDEVAAGFPIEISSTLAYEGSQPALTISGARLSAFGLRRLDGLLELPPGPTLLICSPAEPLVSGVPDTETWQLPTDWPDEDPEAGFYETYTQDGQLTLPAGTYLVYGTSSFSIGEGCIGPQVNLRAATVITVR